MITFLFSLAKKLGFDIDHLPRSFVKNTGWVTFSRIIESLLSYFIVILISRYLGAEGLGQYSFLFAFVGMFALLSDVGVTALMIKELSKKYNNANEYISTAYKIRGFLGIFSLILYLIAILFVGKQQIIMSLVLVGFGQLFDNILRAPIGIMRIKGEGKFIAIVNLIERGITFLGAIILLPLTKNLTLFILVLVIAKGIQFLVAQLCTKKYFVMTKGFDWPKSKKMIMQGLPFMFIAVFTAIYVQMDTVMLSFMQGDVVVGWYQSGYKLISILSIIPVILLTFGFPLFSRMIAKNKEKAMRILNNIVEIGMVIITPIIFGVWLIGDRILDFIYQFNSPESFMAFKILIIAELFIFMTEIIGNFVAADKQRQFAIVAGTGAVMNIVLNFLLIPRYSLYGAGIATAITYATMFVLLHRYVNRNIARLNAARLIIIPALASVAMSFIIKAITHMHVLMIIGIGAASYFLLIVAFYRTRNHFFAAV